MRMTLKETVDSRQETGRGDGLIVVILALLAIAGSASAAPGRPFNSPMLLFDAPTADVLPAGSAAIAADVTYPLTKTSMNVDYPEVDASVRFSLMKHLDLAVTAYTFQDYVLDAKYQILGRDPSRFGLAVGVCDVGLQSYVSPIGHDTADAWPDWKYRHEGASIRTWENLSGFAVASIPLRKIARLHIGLGRGRFVGYDGINDYLNTDVFFDSYHQWAIALFGGLEVYVLPNVALVAEASSRDMNSGIRAHFGPVTATVAWKKMEGFIVAKGEPNGTPHFGRIAAGVSCRFDRIDLSGLGRLIPRRECAPLELVPPPPVPSEIPTAPSAEEKYELLPIHFDLDKSDIRPGDAEILGQNAATILAKQKAGLKAEVVIEGHCCPYASEQYNVGLGARRAEAARLYLVGLGVDAALLTTETYGEENPQYTNEPEYPLNRRCEFRWKE